MAKKRHKPPKRHEPHHGLARIVAPDSKLQEEKVMGHSQRVELVQALEAARNSRVISIIMGDRQHMETRIAQDLLPLIARHLRSVGKTQRIDLFLYSTGGDIMAGFGMVSVLREYCSHLGVLVPFKCHSTATLIALGADEIVMLPEGQLSPVDPSITSPYNPLVPGATPQPGGPNPFLPVSVEEVVGYINLARDIGEVKSEDGFLRVFDRLVADIRPLALGQVYRARTQIRMLSRKLLEFHMDSENATIDAIIATLTERLYSHDYLISRREAHRTGLKVIDPSPEVEAAIVALYDQYDADLRLREPFNAGDSFSGQAVADASVDRAFCESRDRCDVYRSALRLFFDQGGQVVNAQQHESWVTI